MTKQLAITKELTMQPESSFQALANSEFITMMAEELDGLELTFDRIKIPGAGGTLFEVPGDTDEPGAIKEFTAVILHHHPMRCYYKDEYSGGNKLPDCGSFDGRSGVGTPGGICDHCPLNEFGTAKNNAKACKNKQRLYLLREGEVFPILISLPTGSLSTFTRYIKRLLGKGRKTSTVVTRFSLKRMTNTGGVAYAQVQFGMDRLLSAAEQSLIDSLSAQVKAYSARVAFDSDVSGDADGQAEYIDPETGEVIQPLTGGR
ncbi:MAG: hypothetical protein LBK46_05715 [Oscillospiraceae bacterium]|jgi:hypothetical protein|nr:hypothetical protein [Oscillospiraceae bacterium]